MIQLSDRTFCCNICAAFICALCFFAARNPPDSGRAVIIPEAQPGAADLSGLSDALADIIDSAPGAEILVEGNSLRLRMYAGDMFRVSRAELSRGAQAALRVLSSRIRAHVPGHITIEGHTADEPTNTPQYPNNWYLSSARAIAVGMFLISETGMDADKITALGYGSSAPLSKSDKAANNRIEIIVTP